MRFQNSITGRVKCRLVSAALEHTINKITEKCDISNLLVVDDITATFWVRRTDVSMVQRIDDHIEVMKRTGVYWSILCLMKRPVLLVGMVIILFLVFYLPTRVLFISVHGNHRVPDTQILDAAKNCGISFGAHRSVVRSEKMKNALLQAIPQLQWACINTRGCVAEITVQERVEQKKAETHGISNIIASRDGLITEVTVYSGTAHCRVGQIVEKGQLLVSGYSDLGLVIKSGTADAEIMAETNRTVNLISIAPYSVKDTCTKKESRYSLQIGKKQIKFYKDSGILPPGCGRINKIYNMTLPGGYRLPISVIREQVFHFTTTIDADYESEDFSWLTAAADAAVHNQMVAGEIIRRATTVYNGGDDCRLKAQYRCREMIAIAQNKELNTVDGKRN